MLFNEFKDRFGKSQWGEDGIIQAILERVKVNKNPVCVEFGAADGLHCSNTWHLWQNLGWNAFLFESDSVLYEQLKTNVPPHVKHKNVSVENLDLLVTNPVDLVSMDVDGLEFSILYNLNIKHSVLIIEHNPTIPPHISFVGTAGQGSSAKAICELAARKGYKFLTATLTNLFFIREDLFDPFEEFNTNLHDNFDFSSVNYIITDYSGNYDIKGLFPYGFSNHTSFHVEAELPEHILPYLSKQSPLGSWALSRYPDFPPKNNVRDFLEDL